jgi:hypothetical protein
MAFGDVVKYVTTPASLLLGVVFDGVNLYYTDYKTGRLYMCDRNGNVIRSAVVTGASGVLGVGTNGNFLVIRRVSPTPVVNQFLDKATLAVVSQTTLNNASNTQIYDYAFDGKGWWLANTYNNRIDYANPELTYLVRTFPHPGSQAIAIATDGKDLYVADLTDHLIYKMDKYGNVIARAPTPTTSPRGMTFDGKYLWLSEQVNYRIYCISIN